MAAVFGGSVLGVGNICGKVFGGTSCKSGTRFVEAEKRTCNVKRIGTLGTVKILWDAFKLPFEGTQRFAAMNS